MKQLGLLGTVNPVYTPHELVSLLVYRVKTHVTIRSGANTLSSKGDPLLVAEGTVVETGGRLKGRFWSSTGTLQDVECQLNALDKTVAERRILCTQCGLYQSDGKQWGVNAIGNTCRGAQLWRGSTRTRNETTKLRTLFATLRNSATGHDWSWDGDMFGHYHCQRCSLTLNRKATTKACINAKCPRDNSLDTTHGNISRIGFCPARERSFDALIRIHSMCAPTSTPCAHQLDARIHSMHSST